MSVNVKVFRQIQILNLCISVAVYIRSHYVFRHIVAYLVIVSMPENGTICRNNTEIHKIKICT